MSGKESSAPALQTLFKRVPSIRERTRRRSLGQVSGAAAIHDAVAKGKTHLTRFILDAVEGQEMVDARDAHGKTPLIRAMRIPDADARNKIVDLLLGHKANVNLQDNVGRGALTYACELGCNVVVKKLIQNNVDPNLEDHNGNTPLMYCALANNADAIATLSRSFRRLGLEVDKMNADGMTPLMEAAKNGYLDCARLLAQEAKACVHSRDVVRNMNAAEWARESGCTTPEIELLLPRKRILGTSSKTRPDETYTNSAAKKIGDRPGFQEHAPKFVNTSSNSPGTGNIHNNGVYSQKHRKYPASMEELLLARRDVLHEIGLRGASENSFSLPDVHSVCKRHPPKDNHQQHRDQVCGIQDPREGAVHSKPTPPPQRVGLFVKRPQLHIQTKRPCSAVVQRPIRSNSNPGTRSSTSMEELLTGTCPCLAPSYSLKSNSLSQLLDLSSDCSQKQSINTETCIDLKIISNDDHGRHRASSQPLPHTEVAILSDNSASCTHLPPITPKPQ